MRTVEQKQLRPIQNTCGQTRAPAAEEMHLRPKETPAAETKSVCGGTKAPAAKNKHLRPHESTCSQTKTPASHFDKT